VLGGGIGIDSFFADYCRTDKINFTRYHYGMWTFSGIGAQVGQQLAAGCTATGHLLQCSDATLDFYCSTTGGSAQGAGIDITTRLGPSLGYSAFTTVIALSAGLSAFYTSTVGIKLTGGLDPASKNLWIGTAIAKRNSGDGIFHDRAMQGMSWDLIITQNNGRDGYGSTRGLGFNAQDGAVGFGHVNADFNRRYGMLMGRELTTDFYIKSLYSANNLSYGFYIDSPWGRNTIGKYISLGNGLASIYVESMDDGRTLRILNSSMSDNTKLIINNTLVSGGYITFRNMNGVVGDNRNYISTNGIIVQSVTDIRHTESGLSWKMSPSNTRISGQDVR
jgi:hypothetical protein